MSYSRPPRETFKTRRRKPLPADYEEAIAKQIKSLLHAHRDCLRNQDKDTSQIRFDVRDGYYGEAFGMLRTLDLLGYGYHGAINTELRSDRGFLNLDRWFEDLCNEVLEEENYEGNQQCDHCLEKWSKDGAGRRRP